MNICLISHASEHVGEEVTLQGWVYNLRKSGKIWFLLVRDGTGIMQGVVSLQDVDQESFALKNTLTLESSVRVTGIIREDRRAPGGYELLVKHIEVVALAEEYPIGKKEHGVEFLMDHRHLWLRSRRQHAILRIRHTIIKAIRDFFDSREFTLIDTPIFQKTATEGTATLFRTKYFDDYAYLTQSGQLYAEAAAAAFGKVYCFGPTFRAEKSKTRRHLTEFWMVEPEMAYYDLDMDAELAQDLVVYIVEQVLTHRRPELETLERDISRLEKVKAPFPRIRYDEAVETIRQAGEEFEWGDDFGGAHETIISQAFDKPVIITHYPAAIKPFYMKRDPGNDQLALAMDMLAPEGYGEIVGGSQREEDLDKIVARLKAEGVNPDNYYWYLDLRRYGSFPHSGFGLGVERTVAWICGLPHVRETIPFPRLMNRLEP